MGCGSSHGLELTNKDIRQCVPVEVDLLSSIGVHLDRVLGAEGVVRLSKSSPNDDQPLRLTSTAVATNGRLVFELKSSSGQGCCNSSVADAYDVSLSIFDLREIRVDPDTLSVELKVQPPNEEIKVGCTYQTPDTARFLRHVATAALRAYVGSPPSTVPLSWDLNGTVVPAVSVATYDAAFGSDGGFTTVLNARMEGLLQDEETARVASRILSESGIFSPESMEGAVRARPRPQLNVFTLAQRLTGTGASPSILAKAVELILSSLAFNLYFKSLSVALPDGIELPASPGLLGSIAGIAQRNVSLVTLDMTNCTWLSGNGAAIGDPLSENPRPVISRWKLSNCNLTSDDLRDLLIGFARTFCGSTPPEVLDLSKNSLIDGPAFDALFNCLVDPRTFQQWPGDVPPAPSLVFLTELRLGGCSCLTPGLSTLLQRATGLKTLDLSHTTGVSDHKEVFTALLTGAAPLEVLDLSGLELSEELKSVALSKARTLRMLRLQGCHGDGSTMLVGWPMAVPKLCVEIYGHSLSIRFPRKNSLNVPGKVILSSSKIVGKDAPEAREVEEALDLLLDALQSSSGDTTFGLKTLVLDGQSLAVIQSREDLVASLEVLECSRPYPATPPDDRYATSLWNDTCKGLGPLFLLPPSSVAVGRPSEPCLSSETWHRIGSSGTLKRLVILNQLHATADLEMLGQFLRQNRSVAAIFFDSSDLELQPEGLQALRGAFYGNKKVVEMDSLRVSLGLLAEAEKNGVNMLWRKVADEKLQIKMLFKRAYSKYNFRWRDGPNRAKEPHVENIRMAKRMIGKVSKAQTKRAALLKEIAECVTQNQRDRTQVVAEKAVARLQRSSQQVERLAEKRNSVAAKIVKKLHKARAKGRKGKTTKSPIPLSKYYDNFNASNASAFHRNDPFRTRSKQQRHRYRGFHSGVHPPLGNQFEGFDWDQIGGPMGAVWGGAVAAGTLFGSHVGGIAGDAFNGIDGLLGDLSGNANDVLDGEFLDAVHCELAGLGEDVVAEVCPVLDDAAALGEQVADKAEAWAVDAGELAGQLGDDLGLDGVVDNLEDLPDMAADFGEDAVDEIGDMADDAADAVDMYAAAEPQDPEDGPPPSSGHAVKSGRRARRRALQKKKREQLKKFKAWRKKTLRARPDVKPYKSLRLAPPTECDARSSPESITPEYLEDSFRNAADALVNATMESNFVEPITADVILADAICVGCAGADDVILTTQCSWDRLPNLVNQAALWPGPFSAAVLIRIKLDEDVDNHVERVLKKLQALFSDREAAVRIALCASLEGCGPEGDQWAPYPINHLRNLALLGARRMAGPAGRVFLLDVDFMPSSGLYDTLTNEAAPEGPLVVPAFEIKEGLAVPKDMTTLKRFVSNGDADGFHLAGFPQGHGPTDFPRFLSCGDGWESSYSVFYEECYEPYVVLQANKVPLYDERFAGYGMNKVTHLAALAQSCGARFMVVPGAFVAAEEHPRSKEWHRLYGENSESSCCRRLALKGLYRKYLLELRAGQQPVLGDTVSDALTELIEQEHGQSLRGRIPIDDATNEGTNEMGNEKELPRSPRKTLKAGEPVLDHKLVRAVLERLAQMNPSAKAAAVGALELLLSPIVEESESVVVGVLE